MITKFHHQRLNSPPHLFVGCAGKETCCPHKSASEVLVFCLGVLWCFVMYSSWMAAPCSLNITPQWIWLVFPREGVILEWYLFYDRVWGLRRKTQCPWICHLHTSTQLNQHQAPCWKQHCTTHSLTHREASCDVATTKTRLCVKQSNR